MRLPVDTSHQDLRVPVTCLELPEKTETVIKLDFDPQQKKIYRDTALIWNKNLNTLIEEKGEAVIVFHQLQADATASQSAA